MQTPQHYKSGAARTLPEDELEDFLRANYAALRKLPDGSFIGMRRLLYTTAIFTGLTEWGYERRFCFQDPKRALQEFELLQSEDMEPTGWIARR